MKTIEQLIEISEPYNSSMLSSISSSCYVVRFRLPYNLDKSRIERICICKNRYYAIKLFNQINKLSATLRLEEGISVKTHSLKKLH